MLSLCDFILGPELPPLPETHEDAMRQVFSVPRDEAADAHELAAYRRLFAEYVTDRRECHCVKQFAIPDALRCGLTLEQITVLKGKTL